MDANSNIIDEIKSSENMDFVHPQIGVISDNVDVVDTKLQGVEQDDVYVPEENDNDIHSSLVDIINKSNFYLPEKQELLEIAIQYNKLIGTIEVLNNKLEDVKRDVIRANSRYDEFKRSFANVIDDSQLFEKLYYVLPIFTDYDGNDLWVNQWLEIVRLATKDENYKDLRNFINKYLYGTIFSLPKDVYCYKITASQISGVSESVQKFAFVLASRIAAYIKYIKDISDQLRHSMYKTLMAEPVKSVLEYGPVSIVPKCELETDLEFAEKILADKESSEKECELINKYKFINHQNNKIFENQDGFIAFARTTYQKILDFQNVLNTLGKQVYTSSLVDLYKLYDNVSKSLNDLSKIQCNLPEIDDESQSFVKRVFFMLQDLLNLIEKYLRESYNIRPLKEIQEGINFNNIDITWYDVLVAIDAPSEELVECIASISDTGFAKFNNNDNVEFVVRPAKVSVYSKKIAATQDTIG